MAGAAQGHEFWIEPEDYTVEPGGEITARLITGMQFEGAESVYLPSRFRRFEIESPEGAAPVEGRAGDRPALDVTAPKGGGLLRIVHVSGDSVVTWDTMDELEAFVEHKDAAWVMDAHRERGLAETGIREVYSRYARSLVAVGDGAGEDRPSGLVTEIVALANPYTDDMSGGLPVRVLYEGAPRSEAQVEIFERAPSGEVAVTTTRTDAEGVAVIPVRGGHEYMLDSVVLREPATEVAEASNSVWESLWANLTFMVPGE